MKWSQSVQYIVLSGAIHLHLTLNLFLCSQWYTMLSLDKNARFVVNLCFVWYSISLLKKHTFCTFLAISEDMSLQLLLYFV